MFCVYVKQPLRDKGLLMLFFLFTICTVSFILMHAAQRFFKMLMNRFINLRGNLRRLPGQKELNDMGSCRKRQRKRHTENCASMNL